MYIVRSNFLKYAQFFGRLFLKSDEIIACFYISTLFYPITASLNKKYFGKQVGILHWAEIKKLNISDHGGSVKAGVKQKIW